VLRWLPPKTPAVVKKKKGQKPDFYSKVSAVIISLDPYHKCQKNKSAPSSSLWTHNVSSHGSHNLVRDIVRDIGRDILIISLDPYHKCQKNMKINGAH